MDSRIGALRRGLFCRQSRVVDVNNLGRNLVLWAIIVLLLVALFNLFQEGGSRGGPEEIEYSTFLNEVESGNVERVHIEGEKIKGIYNDRQGTFITTAPEDPQLIERLRVGKVGISVEPMDSNMLWGALISWLPMLLIIGFWVFFMRQMQSGGGKAMGFGKSKARLLTDKRV